MTERNLLADPGPMLGLYVVDVQSGSLKLVSVMEGPEAKAKASVPLYYNFSRDGRYLAFTTSQSLDVRDTNSFWDAYLYDTTVGAATLISFSADNASAGNADSTFAAISPDGRFMAFRSAASNLGISSSGTKPAPVFVRTVNTGVLRKPTQALVNAETSGTPIQFDGDSTRVTFKEGSSTFKTFDLTTAGVATVCTNCGDAAVSENGQWAAFTSRDNANPRNRPVVLKDLASGVETRLTATNQFCHFPRIASNGDFVVFECWGPLLANDVNGTTDIYLYNRMSGSTNLLSARAGLAGNGPSLRPVLSADNSFVLFRSMASDLIANDFNDAADLFLAYLPGVDSDGDGIDDRWEIATFRSLERNGEADSDLDGLSDRDEFLAGTDPKLSASAVKLETAVLENGGVRMRWFSVPGRSYRIQGTSNLNGGWIDLMQPLIGSGFEDIVLVKPESSAGFYFRLIAE